MTIAVPTFNRAAFLDETIESLLAQDWQDLEILVVDDGSTDDTPAVLERLCRRSAAIRVLRQVNGGEASACNTAWRCASGSLFCVVSSDDPQPRELVRSSVAFLKRRTDVIVSYPDWWRLDATGDRVAEMRVAEFSLARLLGLADCFIGPGAFIRRDVVVDRLPLLRDPRFPLVSDFGCWLAMSTVGTFARIPETIAAWRDHPLSTTALSRRRQRGDQHVLLFEAFFERTDLPAEIRALRTVSLARVRNLATEIAGHDDVAWWVRKKLGAAWHMSMADLTERVVTRLRRR
ncbi:MAG: glycosyltransferase [Deltaproteobacteria bacterium]|nr:glycosyltransferase [Deltaproteobacteria bacterium]